ncbi:Retrovirus-related Pol polyprotein from transposon RE2 [Vitis vinifera]|uniref:Retrovirus-related Pol polyprotein from transposon RE2 n=1 Tax=Vitis vinifera TaxID=29760 RepID=A0A438DEY7_VITVI|nr:Retrovirus-related Pol polyprotein from transposon RE2 [Vitis vinifera]
MAENTTSRTNVSLISSTSCFDEIISINATAQLLLLVMLGVSSHLSDDDLTIFALNGLGSGFKEIFAAIRARDTPVSFKELHDKLVEHEAFLKREESRGGSNVTMNNTRTFLGNTQPRYGNGQSHNGKMFFNNRNHQGKKFNNNGNHNNHQEAPTTIARGSSHLFGNSSSSNWIVDFGASHHVTGDLSNLSHHQPYEGPDDILLGDGSGLEITHTGSSKLLTPSKISKRGRISLKDGARMMCMSG